MCIRDRTKKLIKTDVNLFLASYYLERGIDPNKVLSLKPVERDFYLASALFWWEKKGNGNL